MAEQTRDVNRQWLLADRPAGMFDESAFKLVESPVPEPGEGELLVRVIWLSVDPYMRGRMRDVKSYVPPVQLGAVMEGGTVGEVIVSNNSDFAVGDIVEARLGWQDFAVTDGKGLRKIDPSLAPIQTALGVLGMPGMTAYFGTRDVMEVTDGDTVLVSAASGAVGGLVGQVARLSGAKHVVGIAGGPEKCRWCEDELGYDSCIDYRPVKGDAGSLIRELKAACPDGVDGYFDNVGGWISDSVYSAMNTFGRIAICGTISEYNDETPELAPRINRHILVNRLRVRGFIVFDFARRYREGATQMAAWLRAGKLKYREDVVDGLENTPAALKRLFEGKNFGKQLVRVGVDPTAG